MAKAEVVVLGGCIIDLVSYAPRFPKPGETMAGTQFCKGFGGKGANQCVMAARLGASTGMIAKLGNDSFGLEILQNMKESGIVTDFITLTNESHTSTASICVTKEGQNSIIYVPGAIMKLNPEDIKESESLIASSKILVCTYEAPLNTILETLMLAKKYQVMTVVNAAPVVSSAYECIYPLVDIICLNEVEAEEVTGISIQSIEDAKQAAAALRKKHCSTVILTLGAQGAVFYEKHEKDFIHVPACSVTPVDSTGAGDAFMGSLAYFLVKCPSLPLSEMIRRSCDIATMSVLKKGTQSSFPYREDIPESLLVAVQ